MQKIPDQGEFIYTSLLLDDLVLPSRFSKAGMEWTTSLHVKLKLNSDLTNISS